MKIKKFDTLKMKQSVQDKIYKEIEGLSDTKLLEYWKQFTLKNKFQKKKVSSKKK